jgi:hypothetical protein
MMEASECALAYGVQVGTHLAMLPGLYVAVRLGSGTFVGTGAATLLTSALYHVCEVMNTRACLSATGRRQLLGMDEGRWHRLDNVFAIASLQLLCLYMADLPLRRGAREALNWLAFFVTLVFQERGPWLLSHTLLPLLPCVALALVRVAHGARLSRRTFGWGVLCLLPAVYCFYRGLDDERDYLRMWHGMWHVAINAAASCFAVSRWQEDRKRTKQS